MDIRSLTAADAATVRAAVDLLDAVGKVDSPWAHPTTRTQLEGTLRHGWDGEPPRGFAGRDGDRLVALGELWTSDWDNVHLAWAQVVVHPDARRRGHASAMLARLQEEARAHGCTSMGGDGWAADHVDGFATHHGFARRATEVNRRQDLDSLDEAVLAGILAEARAAAADYELVAIEGRTPESLIEDLAAAVAAINDAPTDDLDVEDEVFTTDRVRSYEAATLARRQRLRRLVARHRDTGELAGHTVVAVEEERPHIGHQHDTSVVRAHRGHRLGLLLKAEMVRWLRESEPALRTVDTWNAASNTHMVAVNEALGYRVLGTAAAYQRDL